MSEVAMDQSEMLALLGLQDVSELFSDVPTAVRRGLELPDGLSEMEVVDRITSILAKNATAADMPCFLGGGAYLHYVPAAVEHIISRSEFYTSYTPYQPEISQGMLQSLFEYQSLVCEITAMDAANSSMYDGSTALGEAARMCRRLHKGNRFLIPKALNRDKASVLENY
ncbi:MAG: aminomethyl-transferring glycine dehydrogenase, partial [Candidatus Methanomethylophilaceae archaeon]|nr:aminomethyl-transferring glycine dehydrogenase [Candidatus Methanomethylophilaceae archaeon]